MKKITYLLVVATLVFSCEKPKGELQGSIAGTVTNDLKHELQRAKITITDNAGKKESTETGSDGRYEFINLVLGQSYTIIAEITGYYSDTLSTKVDKNGVRGDFILKEKALRLDKNYIDVSTKDYADFIIYNDSQREMVWIINEGVDWLTMSKTSATIQAKSAESIHITLDRNQIPIGTQSSFETQIVVNSSHEYAELTVSVTSFKLPIVTILSTNPSGRSAIFEAIIDDRGFPEATVFGFVFSKYTNPSLENTISIVEPTFASNTVFNAIVTDLEPAQTYYVRAYAYNAKSFSYSGTISFITMPEYVPLSSANIMVQTEDLGYWIHQAAINKCSNSVIGGYTNWRLPTKIELIEIYAKRDSIGGFITTTGDCDYCHYYWTSDEYIPYPRPSIHTYYYVVNFSNGSISSSMSETPKSCRCVRTLP